MITRAQAYVVHALIGAAAAVSVAVWLDRRQARRHEQTLTAGVEERADILGAVDDMALNLGAMRTSMNSLARTTLDVLNRADAWRPRDESAQRD